MSPVAINGVDKQGVYIDGVQVKQALDAANETVDKGVYDPTTLSAVDADLDEGNIKLGVDIFGKVGTVAPGGAETIEMFAEANLASGGTYTPASEGIFTAGKSNSTLLQGQYLDGSAAWIQKETANEENTTLNAIGDGTNFRIKNTQGFAGDYQLMRHYMSTGTYERESTADLASLAVYTPADGGFFAMGSETPTANSPSLQQDFPTEGWQTCTEWATATSYAHALIIGDGTEVRVLNGDGAAARWYALMRAVMT